MPVDADPESSRRIVLRGHEDKPEGEQPAFLVRQLRRRESKRLAPVLKRLQALTRKSSLSKAEKLFDEVEEFVRSALVGWQNQTDEQGKPIPFDAADLDRCIDEAELFELAVLIRTGNLGTLEKKVSGSRSGSSSARAGATASQETAPIDPDPETPSSSGVPNAREPEGPAGTDAGSATDGE